MMNPKFKSAMLGLLGLASLSAYAADEVTLTGGKTISWADFVTGLNDPSTVEGDKVTEDSPAVSKEKAALTAAQTTLKEKNDALKAAQDFYNAEGEDGVQGKLAAAQSTLKDKQSALTTAQGAVTTAKEAVTTAQNALDAYISTKFEKAYNDAVADLNTKKNETLPGLQSNRTELLDQKNKLETQISTAEATLQNLNGQLASLPKKTGTVAWLKTMYTAAELFYNDYDGENFESNAKIYCGIQEYKGGGFGSSSQKKRLLLAFGNQPEDGTPTGVKWKGYSPAEFYYYIQGNSEEGISALATPDQTAVYLGSEYMEISGSSTGYIAIDYSNNGLTLAGNALNAIAPLMDNSKYQGATDQYQDPLAAAKLEGQITTAEAKLADLNKQLNGVHKDSEGKLPEGETEEMKGVNDQLNDINTQITNLNNDISTLQNTTIPALKETWDKAVDGTLEEGKDKDYDTKKAAVATAEAAVTTAEEAVTTAEGAVETAKTAVENAQAAVDAAEKAVKDATADVSTANAAVTTAQETLDNAVAAAQLVANEAAFKNYQEIYLNDNVDATVPINGTYAGTIWGNGKVITIPGTTPLFQTFTGTLNEVAINAPATTFARSNRGTIDYVAVNASNGFRYYNEDGVSATATSIEELGFMAREKFGVNFTEGVLTNKTDESIVYSITVYQPNSTKQNYVQIKNNGFVASTGAAVKVPDNMFAKSETNDIKGFNNIFYVKNGANVCDNVVIKDAVNFFCPVDLNAKAVNYARTFYKGMNTACLPFAISKETNKGAIESVCTYDREDLAQNKFWFTKIDGEIPANTPLIVMATKDFQLNLADIDFKATDPEQVVEYQAK